MIDDPPPVVKPKTRLKMADVARLAGVSVSSVSRALADSPLIPPDLRERIQTIARENGYVVNQAARNLRLQTTRTIGLILPLGHHKDQHLTDPFLLEVIGLLADEVVRRGYDLLLSRVLRQDAAWLLDLTHSHRFDGLLVVGQGDQHEVMNTVGADYGTMVVWGEPVPGQTYATVGVDNATGGRLAARHLIAGGCRDLLFLGPPGTPESEARYNGFRQGLSSTATNCTPDRIDCQFDYNSAYEAAARLVASGRRFDGAFCASDVIAQAVLSAVTAAGLRVPEDVAVCGFDDMPLARTLQPALTTLRQDRVAGARHMVDTLFRRMAGEAAPSVRMPVELIVRGSTRKA